MNLVEIYPELRSEFNSKVILASLLTQDIDSRISRFLESIVKSDWVAPLHTIIRELIQNSIKANLKRYIFEAENIDPTNRDQYKVGMNIFHTALGQFVKKGYSSIIEQQKLMYQVVLSTHSRVSLIHVANSGKLFKEEEARIRHKFIRAIVSQGLYQFYLDDSDSVEGSGMGIALNEIILRQIGLKGRYFSVFSDVASDLTIARLIIPHHIDYKTPRQRFKEILDQEKINASDLRNRLLSSPIRFIDI
ncbi:MAG: hypothetical protein H3C43_02840 [Leptonema sp. (in: Bacteria)]|nr:hypothetical protein [Leptonema sp. (in: bacteria)]